MKILCYIVAYNASAFIRDVLELIPSECWNNKNYSFEVLVSDDASTDDTFDIAQKFAESSSKPIKVQRLATNIGYGGNQKVGYDYAEANSYDAVILLHGDLQYDPTYIPALLDPIMTSQADIVIGSRMMEKKSALKGKMPLYKFVGNIILTKLQNALSGARFTEFHSGFRVYRTDALSSIAYQKNSDGFAFDTEIILQLLDAKKRFHEISIPTHYGEEICHVNGLKYAWNVVIASFSFKLHNLGFIYDKRLSHKPVEYPDKVSFASSHKFAVQNAQKSGTVIDIGGGLGYVAKALRANGCNVIGFDQATSSETNFYDKFIPIDVSKLESIKAFGLEANTVLLLDILEHLAKPENLLTMLKQELNRNATLIITVPNIAFISIRLKLLFGYFNYGSRGILDNTHLRFFTFYSICDLVRESGYEITKIEGIPAPFPLVIGNLRAARFLLKLNQMLLFLHRGLFSFQIGIVAKPRP